MAYLGVGIHDSIVLSQETKINESGTLILGLSTIVDTSNMLGAFEDEGSGFEAQVNNLMIFCPGVLDFNKNPKTSAQVANDLKNIRRTLEDILCVYMTSDKAKKTLGTQVMFGNLGITAQTQAQLPQKLLNEDFVKAVYRNLAVAFVAAVTPFFNSSPLRIKLRRTSEAKHFAKIPPKSSNPKIVDPWIESMQVPSAASTIKWSEYDLKKGLNSGIPSDTNTPTTEDAAKVDKQFEDLTPPTDIATPGAVVNANVAPQAVTPEAAATNPFKQG